MEDKKHFDTPKVEVIEHLKHVRPVLEYVFFGTGLLAFFLAVFMLVLNWGSAMFGFRLLMSGLMLIMFYTFQRISAGLDSFFHIWKCGGKGVKLNENVWRRDTGEKGKDEKTTIWYLNVLQSTFFATGLIAFFLASFVFIARWSSWDSWIFICQASLTGLIVVMLYAFNSASVSFRRCAQALFQKGFEDALTSAFNFRYLEQR
ncbi:MAG: hypothetical protein R6X33_00275, partial [Candidatus Brocadiia bacterium]